ncbi:hypothetical protein [Ferruginivarius sediminum]|uniref:Uncharacterized protein n=1 Tax=Ferruginivarius sediminum TaxID=2661937 RepID=A0A369TEY8_9PROT|nr:hypothetical protein [Ferruginivarius sediminum]RDD63144.1 hypothetical protein DRB17_05090 [Ferruginivarius sediminum]
MQIPGGQVNPGLSFFRALQGLTERPQQPAQTAQQTSTARATDTDEATLKARSEVQQASRPADPTESAARAAETGARHPRGSFVDITV